MAATCCQVAQARLLQERTWQTMHEKAKLDEARYFYGQMLAQLKHRDPFYYNLSAFLSAARSVLQYACKEAKTKPGGQRWYDAQMENKPLGFFRNKRDISIHSEPVKPSKHITVHAPTATVQLSEALTLVLRDADGKVVERRTERSKPESTPEEPVDSGEVTTRYTFPGWNGPEDAILLCRMYLDELERVVEEGMHKGFLTG